MKAAILTASDDLTDDQIAAECGIHRTMLWRWRKRPEFQLAVERVLEEWRRADRERAEREAGERERRLTEIALSNFTGSVDLQRIERAIAEAEREIAKKRDEPQK